jgi:hypothetical protein
MHSFTTCVDAIVEEVQRTFKYPQDMAQAIRELQHCDMQKVMLVYVPSTETDEEKKKIADEGRKIMFDADYKAWLERKELYVSNKSKAYSLILTKYCSSGMKTKLEEHPDFETKIWDDPIELLIAVRGLMREPVRAQYPYSTLFNAMWRLCNVRQQPGEALLTYIKRVKHERDVFKMHFGNRILDIFVYITSDVGHKICDYLDKENMTKEKLEAYKADIAELDKLQEAAFEEFVSYIILIDFYLK